VRIINGNNSSSRFNRLFLFGGVFLIAGIFFSSAFGLSYGSITLLGIGTVLIIVGVEIAKRSKK
tara:strand:+ start:2641 stop:2832 length:192 start_codon:yes stop_codon:yes gene_type:complete